MTTTKWIKTDDGIETQDGATVVCAQYDCGSGETNLVIAKEHKTVLLAAPALLEALENLVEQIDDVAMTAAARAAIDLARGEP